jgi:effector-binding domain-containing protein
MCKRNVTVFFIAAVLLSSGCQNNSKEKNLEPQTSNDSLAHGDGFISSNEDFVITPTTRPEMYVIGKLYPESKPENIKTLLIGTAAELNQIIADSMRIMTGPIMVVYDNLPQEGVNNQIFIGIPINKPIKNRYFGSLTLKQGRYHKAKTMAEIGKSSPYWTKVTDKIRANGYEIGPPFIEYPSDTRTGEMTSVITYCNLLLPDLKKP